MEGRIKMIGLKRFLVCSFILLAMFLVGCKQKEIPVIIEKEIRYGLVDGDEAVEGFTVDDDGNVYIASIDYSSRVSDPADLNFFVHIYNPNGEVIETHNIKAHYYNGGIDIDDGVLYFAAHSNMLIEGFTIHGYDLNSKELKTITNIDKVKNIENIVIQEKKIFVLTNNAERPFTRLNSIDEYIDLNDKLIYHDLEAQKTYELPIEKPLQIAKLGTDRLGILSYYEDQGHCFMEYNVKEETAAIISGFGNNIAENFAISEDEKSVLHHSKIRGGVVVETSLDDFTDEVDMFDSQNAFDRFGILRRGNYLYFVDKENNIVKLNLENRNRDSKTIRLVYSGTDDDIYGNGFKLERTWLTPGEYALKVLSGDGTYDISLWSSKIAESAKMKESGFMYPLNEIRGIEEYLDSCFPYVREAATHESGDIWMLPLKVEPHGYLINMENVKKSSIPIKEGMTYQEYAELIRNMSSDKKNWIDADASSMLFNLFMQMKENGVDIDSDVFREIYQETKDIYPLIKDYRSYPIYAFQDEFYFGYIGRYFLYEVMERSLQMKMETQGNTDVSFHKDDLFRMYPEPQINIEDKNLANCIFLTVNRNSDNLEETLQFIESYVQYMLEKKDTPLFYKELPEGSSYVRKSIHEFFKNSKIVFNDGVDIYMDNIYKVLEDEMLLEEYIVDTKRKLDMYYNE